MRSLVLPTVLLRVIRIRLRTAVARFGIVGPNLRIIPVIAAVSISVIASIAVLAAIASIIVAVTGTIVMVVITGMVITVPIIIATSVAIVRRIAAGQSN